MLRAIEALDRSFACEIGDCGIESVAPELYLAGTASMARAMIARTAAARSAAVISRPLTAADLGVDAARIASLRGAYFELRGGVATVNIDGLLAAPGGLGRGLHQIMGSPRQLAQSSGANTLRIESQYLANPRLRAFLERYGSIETIPGPFAPREAVTIPLGGL